MAGGNDELGDDSVTGSKRTDRLVVAALLTSLGGGAVSLTKDTSDRYKTEDARRDKAEIRAEILHGNTVLRSELSRLQETVRSHHIEAGQYKERVERNADDIDEIYQDFKEYKRRAE